MRARPPRKDGEPECVRAVPYAGHAGDDDMWHIPIFGNNLQPFDRLAVSDNVLQHLRSVFFNPKRRNAIKDIAQNNNQPAS